MEALRDHKREEVLRLAESHGARNIRVFGSVARGEASDTSDLDLLVEWEALYLHHMLERCRRISRGCAI